MFFFSCVSFWFVCLSRWWCLYSSVTKLEVKIERQNILVVRIRSINKTEEKWNDMRKMAGKKNGKRRRRNTPNWIHTAFGTARVVYHTTTHIWSVLWESNWIEEKAQHSRFFSVSPNLSFSLSPLSIRMRSDRFRRTTHWVCVWQQIRTTYSHHYIMFISKYAMI